MKVALKIIFLMVILATGIVVGYFGGEIVRMDLLCNDPEPAVTTETLYFNDVVISKGATIPMRSCEYANRFTLHFGLPNKLDKDYFEYISEPVDSADYAGGIGNISNEQ
jgi:uncharacterized membrane protein YeiH